MTEHRIIRNAVRCIVCGDVIESTSFLDTKMCSCGNAIVSGGHDYVAAGPNSGWDSIEYLTEWSDEP